jgi:alkylation response protein AidB-like acyl-CoA dehydrogenase
MDINLSPSEEAFRQEIRTWFKKNLPREWQLPRVGSGYEYPEVSRKWQKKLGEAGLLGLAWPKEYGGRGATLMEQAIFMMESGRANAPFSLDWVGQQLLGPTLIDIGTPQLKARYLGPIIKGETVWCQGFSEPNAGSDLANLQTRAVPEGNNYLVNGQKIWSSTAKDANWCMLLARTNPDVPKHKGLTMFAVDMETPGIRVQPIKQINGLADFNEIFFDSVKVPRENVIGEVDGGWQVAMRALTYERGLYTLLVLAKFEASWAEMRDYVRSTRRNGRLLAEDPRVREQMAQCYADIELMRLTNLRYISRYMRGIPPGEESSLMKIHWSTTEQRLYDLAMGLGGPASLAMLGSPTALMAGSWTSSYLFSRSVTIYGGTQDIQRNLIAERIYGLPR